MNNNDPRKQTKIHPSQITSYHNFYILSSVITWGLIVLSTILLIYSIAWLKDKEQIIAVRLINEVILILSIFAVSAFESSRDTYKAIYNSSFGGLNLISSLTQLPRQR